jgi:hypothetical protein
MPVVVEGVPELKKALKKFAPDLLKEMNSEIRLALKEVTKDAKAKVPSQAPGNLYNWNDKGYEPLSRIVGRRAFPLYNSGVIRRGLTYSIARKKANSKGFASLYALLNKSPVGAIVETAGSKSPFGRKQIANRNFAESYKNIGNSNNPDAGRIFVGAMNGVGPLKRYDNKSPNRGRLLYAAYAENNGKALDATMKAIAKAANTLKTRTTVRKAA